MKAQQLLARHRKQAERIVVAQIGFRGKWKMHDVGERAERIRTDARGVEFAPDMCNALIDVRQRFSQPPQLQRSEIAPRHGFGFTIEHEQLRFIRSVLRGFWRGHYAHPGLTAPPGRPEPRTGVWLR